jgi:hypothetical protein
MTVQSSLTVSVRSPGNVGGMKKLKFQCLLAEKEW